jgi:hypothetical protein
VEVDFLGSVSHHPRLLPATKRFLRLHYFGTCQFLRAARAKPMTTAAAAYRPATLQQA